MINKDKLEKKLARLEEIANKIQNPNVDIDEALNLYKESAILAKECRETISKIETEIQELSKDDIRKQAHEMNQRDHSKN